MADWVKRGGALPNIPELVAELTVPAYTFKNGKFLMEEKDQIKKRLKRSPDFADALALTFALPDLPAEPNYGNPGMPQPAGHLQSDYDPYNSSRQ